MSTVPLTPTDTRAETLRHRMVDELVADGLPSGPLPEPVAAAMRRVPRHVFVAEVAVADAYRPDDHVVFEHGPDGRPITSLSAPRIVALQLAQLMSSPAIASWSSGSVPDTTRRS
jgi:protein-L-isoaspartate O-methyltransferase